MPKILSAADDKGVISYYPIHDDCECEIYASQPEVFCLRVAKSDGIVVKRLQEKDAEELAIGVCAGLIELATRAKQYFGEVYSEDNCLIAYVTIERDAVGYLTSVVVRSFCKCIQDLQIDLFRSSLPSPSLN
ncbi:MAG: hypothetical protein HYT03_02500 [Candidatus Harrisonbacteria bacterium]|nr:hypothetical protein [Candidatus Harrisonbacteria bacterium]